MHSLPLDVTNSCCLQMLKLCWVYVIRTVFAAAVSNAWIWVDSLIADWALLTGPTPLDPHVASCPCCVFVWQRWSGPCRPLGSGRQPSCRSASAWGRWAEPRWPGWAPAGRTCTCCWPCRRSSACRSTCTPACAVRPSGPLSRNSLMVSFPLICRAIPESPRWLLLQRRKDVLEGYRSNSPADQKCLDLVKLSGGKTWTSWHVSASVRLSPCVPVQLLDSAWSDLHKASEAQTARGHAPSDITQLRHPTILLRLFIMSYLRYCTHQLPTGTQEVWFNNVS